LTRKSTGMSLAVGILYVPEQQDVHVKR
jgi:hypothetical protein